MKRKDLARDLEKKQSPRRRTSPMLTPVYEDRGTGGPASAFAVKGTFYGGAETLRAVHRDIALQIRLALETPAAKCSGPVQTNDQVSDLERKRIICVRFMQRMWKRPPMFKRLLRQGYPLTEKQCDMILGIKARFEAALERKKAA